MELFTVHAYERSFWMARAVCAAVSCSITVQARRVFTSTALGETTRGALSPLQPGSLVQGFI